MNRQLLRLGILFAVVVCLTPANIKAQRVLFDARHGQTAGNADWIVDADSKDQEWDNFRCTSRARHSSGQRFPTPSQDLITEDTPETFWHGGISAWAVDLVKDSLARSDRDWRIEQYPWDGPEFTFGDATNPIDLSNYDVLILCEPNVLFTDAEAQAIREFVAAGGGLFLCADHETSDRNCSGKGVEKHDSPFIFNRMMQTAVETQTSPPYMDPTDPANDYGVFGIWFYENGNDDPDDQDNRRFDWFDDKINNNVVDDPDDPILHGPFGDGTGGLGLFGSTQMAVSTHPERGNPTAKAHIFRTGQTNKTPNSQGVLERVTLASAELGAGRVVAVGDSSPADDDTGDGRLHPGWDKASGGVANREIFLNATEWLANVEPDTTPPVLVGGPAVAPADCSALVTWITDEPADSVVLWGVGTATDRQVMDDDFTRGHSVEILGLAPDAEHALRVRSSDRHGNGPVESDAKTFRTTAQQLPVFAGNGPEVSHVTHQSAQVRATLGKRVRVTLQLVDGTGAVRQILGEEFATLHTLTLDGLEPETEHRLTVEATDACGTTIRSDELTFTTAEAPREMDLSGFRLINDDNAQFAFDFPQGTRIPAEGFLVVGRDNDQAAFEQEWGPLAPGVVYVDSGDEILVNSTARRFTLLDAAGRIVDGATIPIRSGQSIHRRTPCTGASVEAAWEVRSRSLGDPGSGSSTSCGAGLVIHEIGDGADFHNEFVELYFDAEP